MVLDDTAKMVYTSTNQDDLSSPYLNASQGEPRMSENNITVRELTPDDREIGRASCRERV